MAPPPWTTPEQHEWLSALRSKFAEHQKSKKVTDFWLELDRDWFTRWPESGVAEAELEPPGHPSRDLATEALRSRKSKLKNWFNNRSVDKRRVPIKIEPVLPNTRSQQPVEIYSQQFYKEKVQPLVKSEVTQKNVPRNEQLEVVKRLTKEAFEAEPEDVRTTIIAEAELRRAKNAARKAEARSPEPDVSPESYAAAIETVPALLDAFFHKLAKRTGWAFSVVAGGPDPLNDGRIQTVSFHEGKNSLGASFKRSHVSFELSVLKPFVEFLHQVYPPGVCNARALSGTNTTKGLVGDRLDNTGGSSAGEGARTSDEGSSLASPVADDTERIAALDSAPHTIHSAAPFIPIDPQLLPPTLSAPIDPQIPPALLPAPIELILSPGFPTHNEPQLLLAPPSDIGTALPASAPSTASVQPFVFPSTVSFASQTEIGAALNIPGAPTSAPPSIPPPTDVFTVAAQPKTRAVTRAKPKKLSGMERSLGAVKKSVAAPPALQPSDEPNTSREQGGVQGERSRRVRKAAMSKEVPVPLTKQWEEKENETRKVKKARTQ